MKHCRISGIMCIFAWLICSILMTMPSWRILHAQDFKDETQIEAESLSIRKYVPPDTSTTNTNEPKNDKDKTGIGMQNDVIQDSTSVFIQSDSLLFREELRKKKFIGTGKDIGIAFATLVGWLAVMWLAANQRE